MKRYNTPHRSRVVKTRMTEEEYAEFAERLSAYNMSQAEFIRQAITGAAMLRDGSSLSAVRERRIEYELSYDRPTGAGAALPPFKNTLGHFVPRS